MNIQEAIYQLHSLLRYTESQICGDEGCDEIYSEDKEALEIGIAALEQQ